MALMGSWNGFEFEVSPTAVRGFTGLTIKGGSETEDKVSDKQKYVQRKNSAVTEIALSIYLNAYLGCNVREEADRFIHAAMEGAQNYFYVGGKKLVTYKLMLTQAEVTEMEIAPDATWIACKINLTMKQCEKYGGASHGSSGSSGSSKQPAKKTTKTQGVLTTLFNTAAIASQAISNTASNFLSKTFAQVEKVINEGKTATKTSKKTTGASAGSIVGGGKSQIMMTTLK